MHPYSETFDMAMTSASILCDKPLMFTEWGGYYVYDKPDLLTDFLTRMYSLYKDYRLAGTCLWYWAEINDYNRGGQACVDGTLKEALVDFERKPNVIYSAFCNTIKSFENEETADSVCEFTQKTAPCKSEIGQKIIADLYEFEQISSIEGISLQCAATEDYEGLLALMKKPLNTRLAKTRRKQIECGAVLQKEEIKGIFKVPFVVGKNPLVFKAQEKGSKISILGLTAINYGYPLSGSYGEDALKIQIAYADGTKQEYVAKNGIDISIAYASVGSSRINPVCERASLFARFSYDKNFEEYIINKLEIDLESKEIDKVEIKSINENYNVLVYGIYVI